MRGMTQEELRVFLIQALRKELPEYRGCDIPPDAQEQKQLLRSLMNVRPPIPAAPEFLEAQDAYLSEEIRARGIVDCAEFTPARANSRMFLWKGDITRLKADAIVNAANRALLGCFIPCHSCIDNVIHTMAGIQLRLACHEIMQAQGHEEPVGTAKITPGYNLPCKAVLHTVGPIIAGPLREHDRKLLASSYQTCLELAVQKGIRSVAFCCISTGVFRFPQEEAAEIAVHTVSRFLEREPSIRQVIFDVYTNEDLAIYQRLLEW